MPLRAGGTGPHLVPAAAGPQSLLLHPSSTASRATASHWCNAAVSDTRARAPALVYTARIAAHGGPCALARACLCGRGSRAQTPRSSRPPPACGGRCPVGCERLASPGRVMGYSLPRWQPPTVPGWRAARGGCCRIGTGQRQRPPWPRPRVQQRSSLILAAAGHSQVVHAAQTTAAPNMHRAGLAVAQPCQSKAPGASGGAPGSAGTHQSPRWR